jgi:carboxymethylenebutenolidase
MLGPNLLRGSPPLPQAGVARCEARVVFYAARRASLGSPTALCGAKESSVKRLALAMSTLLLLAPTIAAQDWARAKLEQSPRHREWVTVKHGNRSLETMIVYPETKEKRPVVLLIHEIFGHSDWFQEAADEVAAAGYIAVAPDLLSGAGPNGGPTRAFATQNDVIAAIGKLDPDQITADLNAAADYGLKLPAANGKLYVAGFCWGGSQTFRFATNRADLVAAFVFYGTAPMKDNATDRAALARIKCPVYGFYGGSDARVDATVPDTTTAMKELGKSYDPVTYEGAGHGFMRAGEQPDASEANAKARTEAWQRWKSLMTP